MIESTPQSGEKAVALGPCAYGDACYEDGRLTNQGSNANYWSSTTQSAANAYNLNFNTSGNVNPVNYNNKYNGRAVRCIENFFSCRWVLIKG